MKKELRAWIADTFMVDAGAMERLADDDSLMNKGIIDSTGVLELVGYIEQSAGFRVADEDMIPPNLDSVNAVVAFVESKTQRKLL